MTAPARTNTSGDDSGRQTPVNGIQPKPKADVQVGVSSFLPWQTPFKNVWEALRTEDVTVRELTSMRRTDGQARALYRLITLPIRAALKTATFVPEEGVDGGDEEALFIQQMFTLPPTGGGMTVPFGRFIAELLMAIFDGFEAFEMVYWQPKAGPLKGKWTLKKLAHRPSEQLTFLLDDNSEFVGLRQQTMYHDRQVDVVMPAEHVVYYACLAAQTNIPLLDGSLVPIADLADRKDPFWVYSIDGDGRVVPGRALRAWKTGRRRTVEVVLDDGSVVRSTPDHRFMLRDGTFRQARDLNPGDSLMPLYRREKGLGRAKKPYEQVYSPADDNWKWTHRVVADHFYGPGKTGWVTHHVDLNAFNNAPTNLARVTQEEHYEIHKGFSALASEALRRYWAAPGNKEQFVARMKEHFADPGRKEAWRSAVAEFWSSSRGAALRAQISARTRRNDVTYGQIEAVYRSGVRSRSGIAAELGVDPATILNRLKEQGYVQWKDFVRHIGLPVHRRAVDREAMSSRTSAQLRDQWQDPEYRAAQSERSRKRLASNWSDSQWAEQQRAKLRSGWEKRRTRGNDGTPSNHKVVEVRLGGVEDVYDIEVESWHNFATENVFVHNCNEEERPFYGISYFNAAYKHWEAKFKLYVVAHIAAQRAAVGTRVGTMPQSPSLEEKREFQRSLADLGIAQWMTIPENYKVESLKEASSFDFLAYINHHNSQMSKSVLAAFFDDSQGTGGDASLVDFGRQSDALFLLMLQTIMGEIEEKINTAIIPKFIDWNFGSGKYPLFRFGTMTDEQKGALLDLYKALAVVSPDATSIAPEMFREIEKQIADEFGLEVDWEAVQTREDEEAAQAEMMMQQQQMNEATGAPDAPDVAAPAIGGPATTLPAHGANINPANVPDGFTLSNRDDVNVTLTEMAASLLDDAVAALTRGRPNSGGPKFVRSVQGASTYGVPVGSPITRDMDKRLAKHGQKGAKYGRDHSHNPNPTQRHTPGQQGKSDVQGGGKGDTKNVKSEVLGGGKGAQGDTGGVAHGATPGEQTKPQRIFTNPGEPGAQLIDYGDGTVAIRDASGKLTPRQRFNIALFAKFGWKVDNSMSAPTPTQTQRTTGAADKKPGQ